MKTPKNKDEESELVGHIKQQKFLGKIKPEKGHTVFEFNLLTGEIKKAMVEEKIIAGQGIKKKLIIQNGFYYVSALNMKNAKKKILKQFAK